MSSGSSAWRSAGNDIASTSSPSGETPSSSSSSWYSWLPTIQSPFSSASQPAPGGGGTPSSSTAHASSPHHHQNRRQIAKMDHAIAQKFKKTGEKYNVKVVLRGDSSTGKTAMLRRLRGGDFISEYAPTNEIKTAHVEWKAKGSLRDEIMLEVWDVVDKANARKISESLTLAHRAALMNGPVGEANGGIEEGAHTFPLDATMIDVYANAHAAIFCVDPSKRWTYEYVLREIEKVPTHLPVAICLNFRDYPASKRILHLDDVEQEVARLFSETRPIRPFVFETSMLNNFGLKALSTFLHVPFLCLKRTNLESQLKQNTGHIVQAQEALRTMKTSSSYEQYQRKIEDSQEAKMTMHKQQNDGGEAPSAEGTISTTVQKHSSFSGDGDSSKEGMEDALTFSKLSNTKIGEVPIVLASAAISSAYAGVSSVASQTPAELAENLAKNAKQFATLGLAGDGKPKNSNFKEATEEELKVKVPPQFSHLPGGKVSGVGGKQIEEPLGAMEKLILDAAEKKDGGKDDFFDDDDDDNSDNDRSGRDWDEDGTPKKSTVIRMDGWEDSDDDDDDDEDEKTKNSTTDVSSPTSAEFIRAVPKTDPFFGGSKLVKTPADKAKEAEEARLRRQREEIAASAGLKNDGKDDDDDDINKLAKAFDYEELKDPNSNDSFADALQPTLGFKTKNSQSMSSTDSATKKKKEKKQKKEKREKKSKKSSS